MNEYLIIAFKTLFFLLIILIIIRIMGKRELGELNVFDIIISFMISEIFSNAIADAHTSIFMALLPIIIIFFVQVAISFIVLKHKKIRTIIESKPSLIINRGVLDYDEMKKQRYNVSDLLQQIRDFGLDNPENIDFAILENNGHLSIIEKNNSKLFFPFPIISDGKIEQEYLKALNLNDNDIHYKLNLINLKEEDVFMAFLDKKQDLIIFSKKLNNIK